MKKFIFCFLSSLASTYGFSQSSVGSIINNTPTVTLSLPAVETALQQHFAAIDASASVTLDSIIIEDDVNDTSDFECIVYHYRITIASQSDELMVSTRYPVIYNMAINSYDLDEVSDEVSGGKFSCAKENCKGCNPTKQPNGDRDCLPTCVPINPEHTTKCTPVFGPGTGGWGPVLSGIGALLTSLGVLIGVL